MYDELQGLVTVRQLRETVEAGHPERTLCDVLAELGSREPNTAENFPHVHLDHSLDTAQRRMASSRSNVLPVIHRTNIRRLNGVLAMEDIQSAYGIVHTELSSQPAPAKALSGVLLLRMVAVTLAVLILIGVVTRAYMNRRMERAANAYKEGVSLQAQGQWNDAIERFRSALSSSPANQDYRLALGSTLVQAGHPEEAALYLATVLRADPANGPANLGMARIAAMDGTRAQVTAAYHKAIFGVWPRAREPEHQEVTMELADYLLKQGAPAEAALELSGLAQQPQTSSVMKKRAGQKLLSIHEPKQAERIFEDLVRANPHDGNAWGGLGEAQFDTGDYQSAQESLKNAEAWGASEDVRPRLETAEEILSMDPSGRGLRPAEKVRRSEELLKQTLALVSPCSRPGSNAQGMSRLLESATKQLKSSRPQNTETAAANVALADELWEANRKWCQTPASPALKLLMSALLK
jgi:tetratricopeptide (TPR) repeat protein